MPDFIILCGDEPIGTSELEFLDDGMGVAHGAFHPAPAYASVRDEIVQATEALYERAEDDVRAPSLQVRTSSGELIEAGFVSIADFGETDAHAEVTVELSNRTQFMRVIGAA